MTEQFRPRGFSLLPVIVKNLLIINVLMYLAKFIADKSFGIDLDEILGLHYPPSMAFKPWQFITYMFMHGNLGHLFFNMFALWMFGYALENIWGPRRFLVYYFITGIGAALVQCLVMYIEINPTIVMLNGLIADPNAPAILDYISQNNNEISQYFGGSHLELQKINDAIQSITYNPDNKQALLTIRNFFVDYREYFLNLPSVIGASGAVYGILLAFGMLFPNTQMIIIFFPFFPIKAKYIVIGYGLMELIYGFTGVDAGVAHFAHLGGMIFGLFLILYWRKRGRLY
jgi:membrane associated rhomboid family serine protease